jgi:8-oxo-dGTP pyrophosphatase MutT (NUDIX family)
MSDTVKEILKRTSIFLIIFGALLLIIGAAGNISVSSFTLLIPDLIPRLIVGIFGGILLILGSFIAWRETSQKSGGETEKSSLVESEKITSKVFLFGYFCTESNGLERKILIFNDMNFSPFMQGETLESTFSFEQEIDKLILNTIETHGVTKDELLKSGISKTTYQRLFQKMNNSMQASPYIFFRVCVQKEFSCPGSEWKNKETLRASWLDENQVFPLKFPQAQEIGRIFRKDYIIQQLGLTILECVDVLVFRKNHNNQIEFLLIHRNRPDEAKVSSKDTWEYPKGGIRYYETYLEGVYREVQEETSITPKELVFCSYLGWQTVNISKRKKPYGVLRVHGYTLYFTGNPNRKFFSEEGHDNFKWVPLNQARKEVWMEEDFYASEFFSRWEKKKKEISHRAGISENQV